MIPAGYLFKRISMPPGLDIPGITDVCSVADCANDTVVKIETYWEDNGFGVASSPDILIALAEQNGIALTDVQLFYYEAYEQEMESNGSDFSPNNWRSVSELASRAPSKPTAPPENIQLLGYDVVVFGSGQEEGIQHSPLSCQGVARSIAVNNHCLIDTLDAARNALETSAFADCKPGVYKIFSVYAVA